LPRKSLSRIWVGILLSAAALLLSGCWAKVDRWQDDSRSITLTKAISARIVWSCTRDHGSGPGRAFCALDTVDALCRGKPIAGLSEVDCSSMASYGRWEQMEDSIDRVARGPEACMSFVEFRDAWGFNFWTAVPSGIARCE